MDFERLGKTLSLTERQMPNLVHFGAAIGMPLRVICAICRFLLRAIFPLNPNKVLPLLASIVSWQQTPPCWHVVIVLKRMQRKQNGTVCHDYSYRSQRT